MSAHPKFRLASIAAGLVLPTAAYAAGAHWDRPSCYIHVHEGCYVNQKSPCTEEEYQDFLRMCDDTYPASKTLAPKLPLKTRQ